MRNTVTNEQGLLFVCDTGIRAGLRSMTMTMPITHDMFHDMFVH